MAEKKIPGFAKTVKWVAFGCIALLLLMLVASINLDAAKTEALMQDKQDLTYFQSFTLERFNGEGEFTQDDLQGYTITVINGWAPWCGPCTGELPELEELSKEYADQGVQVVGVVADYYQSGSESYDTSIQNVLDSVGVTYPIMIADDEFGNSAVPLMANSFPGTWVVDSEGNMLDFVTGARTGEAWQDLFDRWLNGETWIGDEQT